MELEMYKQVNDFVIDGIKIQFVEFHSPIEDNKKFNSNSKKNLFRYNELKKGICQFPYFLYSRKKTKKQSATIINKM